MLGMALLEMAVLGMALLGMTVWGCNCGKGMGGVGLKYKCVFTFLNMITRIV